MLGIVRDKIAGSTTSLFSQGAKPLGNTLDYMGDPGLLGPDSLSWRVIGDTSAFVGGIRALLIQTAHPEVVAGVEQHSRYRDDPLGRLNRTAIYVTETTYGAMPEVEAAVSAVRRAHAPVRGRSERHKPYSARDPELAAWVHNVLTDSFLMAFQTFGPQRLTTEEADRFVLEQTRVGALLDAAPLPATADELSRWLSQHPALTRSKAQKQAVTFLRNPPLSLAVQVGYRPLFNAASATLPRSIRDVIGLSAQPGSACVGKVAVNGLRWALGSSPSWRLALVRCGAAIPSGVFRQPIGADAPVSAPAV
jgi:uncharacterized protein (DUF2236 family)